MDFAAFRDALLEEIPALAGPVLAEDTRFRELPGWDSLAGLMVLTLCETRWAVEISPAELRACRTLGDLHRVVCARLPPAPTPTPGQPG